jgi:aminoglycoside 2'-N-acetyltransferase I
LLACHDGGVAMRVRIAETAELTTGELEAIRRLMRAAFADGFSDEDWRHTLGGRHAIVEIDGEVVSHGAVVARTLIAGDRPVRTGYVEGVATHPEYQRKGWGSAVMRTVNRVIEDHFEMGGLSTGVPELYARLGWERWLGPTFVDGPTGRRRRTEDDDGGVMVLRTSRTRHVQLTDELICDWRDGDVW